MCSRPAHQKITRADARPPDDLQRGADAAFWEHRIGAVEVVKLADPRSCPKDIMTIDRNRSPSPEAQGDDHAARRRPLHDVGLGEAECSDHT